MVDLQCLLEAVDGHRPLAEDASRVVGEHVDVPERGEVCGKGTHVVEPGEVRHVGLGAQLVRHGARLLRRTPDDDDPVAVRVQAPGRGRADAVARTGDDDGPGRGGHGASSW